MNVTVTEDNKRKLIFLAQGMFDDCRSDRDYPFKKWEDQFRELYDLYEAGNLSQKFLDFSSEGYDS